MIVNKIGKELGGDTTRKGKKITLEVDAKAKKLTVEKLLGELRTGRDTDASWFVYLLRCADGSLYTGITNDVARRLNQHNAGTASRYTRGRLPAVLVYQEVQASRSLALKRELAIKGLSRQKKESMCLVCGSERQQNADKFDKQGWTAKPIIMAFVIFLAVAPLLQATEVTAQRSEHGVTVKINGHPFKIGRAHD